MLDDAFYDRMQRLDSEREALVAFLQAQREELIRTLRDLDDEAARRAPSASSLSLLGLVKHAATWESRWFEAVVAGRPIDGGWPEVRTEPRDADLLVDDSDTVQAWVDAYRARAAVSDAILAERDLGERVARTDLVDGNVRYVLLHMIEETARHAGHADIIRETIDGVRSL